MPDYIREAIQSLPPLPASVQQLLTLSREPEVDFRQIVKVIESDQTLTVRTLRAANSAFYGASRQIQTVQQATVLLGRDAIVNLALSISVMNLERSLGDSWARHAANFWRHSIATGTAARWIARYVEGADAEEAFVAGLVHDIGKLVLLTHHGELYGDMLVSAQDAPLHEYEQEQLGIKHTAVGEALCIHWNLPENITDAVAAHHDKQRQAAGSLAQIVGYANDMVKLAQLGYSGNRFVSLHDRESHLILQMPDDAQQELLRTLPQKVAESEQIFSQNGAAQEMGQEQAEAKGSVSLEAASEREREALRLALMFNGYRPVGRGVSSGGDGATSVVATLTDKDSTPGAGYGAWRTSHVTADGDFINADELNKWLTTILPA